MAALDWITRGAFGLASLMLMALAAGLVAFAVGGVYTAVTSDGRDVATSLLDAVGYTIIAVAVFDVGKYILEEETVRARELRHASEARRSLTKFLSTIAIAVFLEGIVAVFTASKTEVSTMIYPTFLLLTGVALIVGLGVFVRLSAAAEQDIGGAKGEARDEAEFAAAERARDERLGKT
ncbi:GNAT family acetyltransferase [Chthonobacter rhizosphaerae]|uniref:GNAT family acetyltransferase n=1 Tax=Chthonobacter rhizosphaerae TaxID=2735553 RepID=UPI0015EFCBFB|nr:GNAT family acetyltransferase [Chthonobacter rhizosphaerae]